MSHTVSSHLGQLDWCFKNVMVFIYFNTNFDPVTFNNV